VESLIILAITFGLLWVLLVLPRRRWQQSHRRMVESLAVGDEVVTSAGIYGTVVGLEPELVAVEVSEGVVVRVARLAIGRRVDQGAGAGFEEPAAADPAATDPAGERPDGADPTDD
jgi:preprotein translocase subunit YajC